MKPRLLDLFCGAGGAGMGYHRAGFEVVGVDIEPQPRYPFEFVQEDALEVLRDFGTNGLLPWVGTNLRFDAIHASPPCQAYSIVTAQQRQAGVKYPDLVAQTRELLQATGLPYVIENVPGSPLHNPIVLCGTEFGLTTTTELHGRMWLKRHRLFESNVFLLAGGGCSCYGKQTVPVYGHGPGGNRVKLRGPGMSQAARDVMGIGWMTRKELDQAIPPAYTELIGHQLLQHLKVAA